MKFVIDLGEEQAGGCYMCPLNNDCISCSLLGERASTDILDNLGNGDIKGRPGICPLVPLEECEEPASGEDALSRS